MRSTILLILTLFVFASKSHSAVIIQGFINGTQKVTGEILSVRTDPLSFLVKIREISGAEHELGIGKVDTQSLSRVAAWMAQTAREQARGIPQARLSSSEQVSNKLVRRNDEITREQSTIKQRTRTHLVTLSNTSNTVLKGVSFRRISKQLRSDSSQDKGRKPDPFWLMEPLATASVQPGGSKSYSFIPLYESSEKSVLTKTIRSISGSSMGRQSDVTVREVKIEVVYLLAFDEVGRLIHFAQF